MLGYDDTGVERHVSLKLEVAKNQITKYSIASYMLLSRFL